MQLQHAVVNQLTQLAEALQQLSPQQFALPCANLFRATIGQHVRHTIELFAALERGYYDGCINYDHRKRDLRLETDLDFACETLRLLPLKLDKPNKVLQLHADYSETNTGLFAVDTNYHRELLYNLEHAVHHMALIRIGFNEITQVALPETFGMAVSTIKHQKTCAQ